MNRSNKIAWFVFAFLAVAVGIYPLTYILSTEAIGLQLYKSDAVLADTLWNIGFYTHIVFGGVALLVGWTQFIKRARESNIKRHRVIGMVYMVAALLSGLSGFYIAFQATGGPLAQWGFGLLAVIWLYFTVFAYLAIGRGDKAKHHAYMIYSYAACFAAVMLRVWLPLLIIIFGAFIPAYRAVAWLCWVPNMIFAFYWVRRKGLAIG